jgi:hypothetical protein
MKGMLTTQLPIWRAPTSRFLPSGADYLTRDHGKYQVRSWAPTVGNEFFERELIGRMSALQIQALNVKLGHMI